MNSNRDAMAPIKKGETFYLSPHILGQGANALKLTLSLVRHLRVSGALNFSFVAKSPQLINKMGLKENLILEAFPSEICRNISQDDLAKKILQKRNDSLYNLYKKLGFLDLDPIHFDNQNIKIFELIKGILRPANFLLIESPEHDLSPSNIQLLIAALKHDAGLKQKSIIVISENHSFWRQYLDKSIVKEKNTILVKPNLLSKTNQVIPVTSAHEMIQLSQKKSA